MRELSDEQIMEWLQRVTNEDLSVEDGSKILGLSKDEYIIFYFNHGYQLIVNFLSKFATSIYEAGNIDADMLKDFKNQIGAVSQETGEIAKRLNSSEDINE